jgi:hypothetical protein
MYMGPVILQNCSLANENSDYGYITFVIITIRFFPHLWLINGFVTRVTRRMPHVKKELITLPEHPRPSPVFIVVRVAWSLVFCVIFYKEMYYLSRKVWIYQRSNQNLYIEEWNTIQWPNEKGQKDKQWSTKYYTEN